MHALRKVLDVITIAAWLVRRACRVWLTQPLRVADWYGGVRVGDVEIGAIIHRRSTR